VITETEPAGREGDMVRRRALIDGSAAEVRVRDGRGQVGGLRRHEPASLLKSGKRHLTQADSLIPCDT
jgi:hypothetical protein